MPDDLPAPAALEPGERVYAVGDVHGCLDRLRALHGAIAADLAARPVGRATLVHLGDYIDRGPDSAGVLALLAAGPPVAGAEVVNLRGNHEDMLLRALDGTPGWAETWLMNGGGSTLWSWGLDVDVPLSAWEEAIPPGSLDLLHGLRLTHRTGGYLFVHAGLRPGVALEAQDQEDLMWIREPFLSHRGPFGPVVVHGHTPAPVPVLRPNRIGIDTGAVMGGALTCLILEGDRLRCLQA